MIFYFSGTGNSKWVAEEMAEKLKDKTADIADKNNLGSLQFDSSQKIGVVFPVYAWAAPEIVLKFVKTIKTNGAHTFAVCTCASEAGHSIKSLAKIFPLNSGYSIIMPSNYIIGAEVDSDEAASEKIKKAETRITEICNALNKGQDRFDVHVGKLAYIKTNLINPGFNAFARSTNKFYTKKDSCNSCGLCEKNCPAKAIKITDGEPAWSKTCYMCLSCINRCPQKAIEFDKSTLGRGRYEFKGK